jgi:hypothetical protein
LASNQIFKASLDDVKEEWASCHVYAVIIMQEYGDRFPRDILIKLGKVEPEMLWKIPEPVR